MFAGTIRDQSFGNDDTAFFDFLWHIVNTFTLTYLVAVFYETIYYETSVNITLKWLNTHFFRTYLIGEKKVGEKWLNFLQVTKFSPDFLFHDQYFSPIFFHLTKNLSRFFFQLIYYYYFFPIYLRNLLLTCFFFDVLYLSWLSKAVLTKISKC